MSKDRYFQIGLVIGFMLGLVFMAFPWNAQRSQVRTAEQRIEDLEFQLQDATDGLHGAEKMVQLYRNQTTAKQKNFAEERKGSTTPVRPGELVARARDASNS